MVIDLAEQTIDRNGYFVIGGKDVSNAQLKVPNPAIMSRNIIIGGENQNFLTNGNEYPIGLLLLYSTDYIPLELSKELPQIFVKPWLNEIKIWAKDMICYAKKAHSDRCLIYDQIHPSFVDLKYTNRQFNEGKNMKFIIKNFNF